jgi:deoxyadenosine/deoxycytidine kinase
MNKKITFVLPSRNNLEFLQLAYQSIRNLETKHEVLVLNDASTDGTQEWVELQNDPDLMVYLRADLPKLQKQISKRGRDFEKNIDPNYLISLNILYEDFANLYTHGKLIIVDVNNLNYAERKEDFEHIVEIIDSNISMRTQLQIQNI